MAAEAQGRRRGTSRHRSAPRYAVPRPVGRAATVLTPVLSLLPAVVLAVVVQALSPAAQRVPTGSARFDLAGAWLATEPGALVGTTSWLTAPTLGRLQLGLLLRVLQAGELQGVLAAAHGAMLLLAVVQLGLLWLAVRRAGAGGVAAGLATAVLGLAPIGVATHAAISATAVAVLWLLVAAVLALGRGGIAASAAAGAATVVGVASAPIAAAVAVPGAALLVTGLLAQRRRRGESARRSLVALGAGAGGAAVLLAAAMGVVAALPATATTAQLDGLTAAAGGPALGAAALASWVGTDPLSLLVAVGALVLTAAAARRYALPTIALVVVAVSLWPAGGDGIAPLVLLLPVVTGAVAVSIDVGIAALGHPRFVRSVLGSAWLAGVGVLLAVAVIGWAVGLAALVPGRAQPIAKVQRWLTTGIPPGQTVLVGLGTWPDLAASGRARVGWYAGGAGTSVPSSIPWSRADYVVTDTSIPLTRSGAAAEVLGRSLAVATYGSGPTTLTVRAVRQVQSTAPPAEPTTEAGRAAARLRRTVGTQLARNPRVEVAGQDRALLLAGAVDTRIGLVLGQFVTAHRVTVRGFGTADGDTSGVRTTVTISEIDGRPVPSDATRTGVLLRFLSDLQGDFRTRSIDAGNDGITAAFEPKPDLLPTGR